MPEGGYWDDELSKLEIDLICGVYIVKKENGMALSTMSEASHRSWWPQPSHFDSGGLNIDFWTRDCEHWFQSCVLECASKPSLMAAGRWQKAMAMQHTLRWTPEKNQGMTAAFLDSFIANQP
ncbi:hypothetical protein PM082_016844 [Marasmius tenuissimus]|nr:hypothetical protein PM082_016844 [Marasmius tenuissimus]